MAKKGFLATLFGDGGSKRSSGSRSSKARNSSSKGRSTSSKTKSRSSASKRTSLASKTKTRARRKSDVGKIYKTTDGYFTQNPAITKKRRVAVIDQRASDGALAVTKIYSKYDENGKERKGKAYIDDLTLLPKKHSSLKQDSVVGNQVHIGTRKAGVKPPAEKNFQPIFKGDLQSTTDKLTKKELKTIRDKLQNDTLEHRATHERTMQKWHDGFKKDK